MKPQDPRLMTISELKEARLSLDRGVTESLTGYALLGLPPGSFGLACLLGDYDLAVNRAHFKLRETVGTDDDIIANMIAIALSLPRSITGDIEVINNWCNQGGLYEATPAQQVLLKLEWAKEIWGPFPTNREEIWSRIR